MSQAAVMSAFGSKSLLGDEPAPTVTPSSDDLRGGPALSMADPALGQPNIQQKITVGDTSDTQQLEMDKGNTYRHDFQKLSSVLKNNRFKSLGPVTKCENKTGFLKIKTSQDFQDVPLFYCVLNRGNLAYFRESGQMGSFEGAVVLREIQEIRLMETHPQCFYLLASEDQKSLSVCTSSESEAGDWVSRLKENQSNC